MFERYEQLLLSVSFALPHKLRAESLWCVGLCCSGVTKSWLFLFFIAVFIMYRHLLKFCRWQNLSRICLLSLRFVEGIETVQMDQLLLPADSLGTCAKFSVQVWHSMSARPRYRKCSRKADTQRWTKPEHWLAGRRRKFGWSRCEDYKRSGVWICQAVLCLVLDHTIKLSLCPYVLWWSPNLSIAKAVSRFRSLIGMPSWLSKLNLGVSSVNLFLIELWIVSFSLCHVTRLF